MIIWDAFDQTYVIYEMFYWIYSYIPLFYKWLRIIVVKEFSAVLWCTSSLLKVYATGSNALQVILLRHLCSPGRPWRDSPPTHQPEQSMTINGKTLQLCHISAMVSQITGNSSVSTTACSLKRTPPKKKKTKPPPQKHHSYAFLAFLRGIHRLSVDYPHKWPVMQGPLVPANQMGSM